MPRDKPMLRELNIPPEILEQCKEMMTNPKYSLHYKKGAIKMLLAVSPCVCGAIPTKEIRYPVEDAGEIPITRVEYFCQSCYDKTQERENEEPKNRSKESLAEFYGVQIGEPNVRQ